jgi:hypothetical protein
MAWDLKADFDRHHLAEVIDPSRMFDHLLTAKGLWAGKVGKTGTIGAISHKNAANVSMIKPRGRGLAVAEQPKFRSPLAFMFFRSPPSSFGAA